MWVEKRGEFGGADFQSAPYNQGAGMYAELVKTKYPIPANSRTKPTKKASETFALNSLSLLYRVCLLIPKVMAEVIPPSTIAMMAAVSTVPPPC